MKLNCREQSIRTIESSFFDQVFDFKKKKPTITHLILTFVTKYFIHWPLQQRLMPF